MSIRFLADEDLDNDIVRGVLRRDNTIDLIRVQDVGLLSAGDSDVLEWAAGDRRLVLSHDVSTMRTEAYRRVALGLPMAGLLCIRQMVPVGIAIEDIILVSLASLQDEWVGEVRYLPL